MQTWNVRIRLKLTLQQGRGLLESVCLEATSPLMALERLVDQLALA
jgi:hypothetical protein